MCVNACLKQKIWGRWEGFLTCWEKGLLCLCSGSATPPVCHCIQRLKYLEKANFHEGLETQVGQDWQEAPSEQVDMAAVILPEFPAVPVPGNSPKGICCYPQLPALVKKAACSIQVKCQHFHKPGPTKDEIFYHWEGWLVFLPSLGSWGLPARSCPISAQWAQQDLMALSIKQVWVLQGFEEKGDQIIWWLLLTMQN